MGFSGSQVEDTRRIFLETVAAPPPVQIDAWCVCDLTSQTFASQNPNFQSQEIQLGVEFTVEHLGIFPHSWMQKQSSLSQIMIEKQNLWFEEGGVLSETGTRCAPIAVMLSFHEFRVFFSRLHHQRRSPRIHSVKTACCAQGSDRSVVAVARVCCRSNGSSRPRVPSGADPEFNRASLKIFVAVLRGWSKPGSKMVPPLTNVDVIDQTTEGWERSQSDKFQEELTCKWRQQLHTHTHTHTHIWEE